MHNRRPSNKKDILEKYTSEEIALGTHIYTAKRKVTKARIHILTALSHFDRPVSIKELRRSVQKHDTATLYRTLETLLKAKLVRKIDIGSTEALYETNIGRPHHHHITCTACGAMESVDACAPMPSANSLAMKRFAEITDHTLEFFGICKRCAV
ncbi:MAG TPA: transcriptional repressor [Candidatus Paceibacterota bacterium]|nr:transcriptional repressor [Candidatus Paceibacterota bacterium]